MKPDAQHHFYVLGLPVPQGSMKSFAFRNKAGGLSSRIVSGASDAKSPLGSWRACIAAEAGAARQRDGGIMAVETPVRVEGVFYLPRPKSAKKLLVPISRRGGDVDKLARALLDGLTGIFFLDDSQVASLEVRRRFADEAHPPGCQVHIYGSDYV